MVKCLLSSNCPLEGKKEQITFNPLSPYLFVLGMEVLSILIDKATRRGYLAGYNFRNSFGDVTNVSHLLFADGTLVFCKDSEDEMLNLS